MTEETAENKTTPKITIPKTSGSKTSGPKISAAKKISRINWTAGLLGIIVIFMLGAGTAVYFLPVLMARVPLLARWLGPQDRLEPTVSALAKRMDQQDSAIQLLKNANNRLTQRLDGLRDNRRTKVTDPAVLARLDQLEKAARRSGKPTENLSQAARIDMLLGRMSQLEASFIPLSKGLAEAQVARRERLQFRTTITAQSASLDHLASRLEAVEAYAARDNNGALIAFRISDLRRKITSGQAFGPEIATLENMLSRGSMAQNDDLGQSMNWLGQHKSGIVPIDRLRAQFDRLVPKMIRAKFTNPDDPWWKKAYHSIRNLVIIRKTEPSDTLDSNTVIITVQRMLARHDLKEALSRLKQLPDSMQAILTSWRLQATIYLQAEDQLNRIKNLAAAYYLTSPDKISPADKISPDKKPSSVSAGKEPS